VVGGRLRAYDSGKTFGAHEVMIHEYQRFEGVSDPDDIAIVYAIESPSSTSTCCAASDLGPIGTRACGG
jgi:hypothetical protein